MATHAEAANGAVANGQGNFLVDYWYAAGWSREITSKPLARCILGRPLALFRTAGGRVGAVEDCCPHRMAPLSLGEIVGETLRCGYHGLRFDCEGACVEIPGQANIPPRAKVRAYRVVERWGLVWIWMGDAAAADTDAIPSLPWMSAPDWTYNSGTIVYDCNYVLLLDNLIDLSHTTFVHRQTIGTDDVARTPIKTTVDAGRVLVERFMNDTDPSVLYIRAGNFTGKVDRWQRIEYTPPTNVIIDAGAVPAGTHDKSLGIDTRIVNIITPESDARTFHFWAFVRNFKLADTALDDFIEKAIVQTFSEDKVLIDGQQRNVNSRPHQVMLDNNADLGVVQARRIVARLMQRED